jgi:uncharacterized protein (TIGR04255 family)
MPDQGHPHLSKAPIAEAAIEIRATLVLPVADATYDTFRDLVADRYPTHAAMRFIAPHFHIESDTDVRTQATMSRVGVRLESVDKKNVVQAKSDGLTVSRLQPYESWGMLIAEVRELWARYREVFAPSQVTRLGVRYINRIPLRNEQIDLDSIFTAGPKIPPKLPQTLEQYLTRIVLPFGEEHATLAIVQALEPPVAGEQPIALLDLDASTNAAMDPAGESMWNQLAVLRRLKNRAFFDSLHPDIWEAFR